MRRQAGTHECGVSCLWKGGFDLDTVLFVKGMARAFISSNEVTEMISSDEALISASPTSPMEPIVA